MPHWKRPEFYISIHGFRSIMGDITLHDTTGQRHTFPVDDGWGGGAKGGVYAPVNKHLSLGVELETYLFRNATVAPDPAQGLNSPASKKYLEVWNLMINLVARYPGETYQPYIGGGVGLSGIEIRGGRETLFTQTNAYQAFIGLRTMLTARWFFFSEYKMVYADHQNTCDTPCFTQNATYQAVFRPFSQFISGGIGVRFSPSGF